MSVFHETQLERAFDLAQEKEAFDLLPAPRAVALVQNCKLAFHEGTDLPETDEAELAQRVETVMCHLAKAEKLVTGRDERPLRVLRNQLKRAREAVEDFKKAGEES